MAEDNQQKPEHAVSRRAFLKGGAIATAESSSANQEDLVRTLDAPRVSPDVRQGYDALRRGDSFLI